MNLFILAAGKGTRLYPLTKNQPKSLIELPDGSTILERQISIARDSGLFKRIYIITGYLSHMIEARVAEIDDVEVVFNPYYGVSNNLFSLWTAHFLFMQSDFMISNGDNIYKNGIYQAIAAAAATETIQITVDEKPEYDDDDMKVLLDENRNVTRVSKQIALDQADCESLGLVLVKGESQRKIFYDKIMQLVRDEDMMQMFWLEIFNSLQADNQVVKTCSVKASDWAEVDFHPDIEMLQSAIRAKVFD